MKRLRNDDDDPFPASWILIHLASHLTLFAHVLGYAYRSTAAVARVCRLFHSLTKQRTYWRYGIRMELMQREPTTWPLDLINRFADHFDPFNSCWPTSILGHVPYAWGDTLRWLFPGSYQDYCDLSYCSVTDSYIFSYRSVDRYSYYDVIWRAKVKHWTYYRCFHPPYGWDLPQGGLIHKAEVYDDDRAPVFYAYQGLAREEDVVPTRHYIWISRYDSVKEMRFEGLCTPSGEPILELGQWK